MLRPVSQATGFPQCLTPRRLRDASDFASILRFRGIYGRHRSQEPVGAATDCIVATDLMI